MKSMKKLVLAGLVLLASVVVLAGCDTPLEPESTTVNEQSGGSENDSVPEVPKYTVKFDKNAEDATGEMTPQTFTQGEKKELTANAFKRSTWTFRGWSEKKDATTPEYKDAAEFTTSKDTTLYAVWRDNGTVSDVTFDSPNGTRFYYDETVTVALSSDTGGATIKYHLGDENWQDYSEEITVTSDTTITAKATKEGLKDSDETTASYTVRKLTEITATQPIRTLYSKGDTFDLTGMEVIASYDGEETRTVTGTIVSDTSSLTETAGVKEITVSYSEGGIEASLNLKVGVIGEATYEFTETPQKLSDYSSSSAPAEGTWTYVKFGDWPQTKKSDDVMVNTAIDLTRGGLDFFVGTDGNYYVNYDNSYYKVEPIVWRVLNQKYSSTGQALLLAEKILIGGIPWDEHINNYMESTIRKWLNGNSGSGEQSDYSGNAGFLQTAFTETARKLITPTTVYNSQESTFGSGETGGTNPYACGDTTDKIFLLSEQEATMSDYGFDEYKAYGNTRIRVITDYAKATGVYGGAGYGGSWWLRSPFCGNEDSARTISSDGYANYTYNVIIMTLGVVPALCVSASDIK